MRDLMERFILLPFTAGCISESSIPVVMQHTKRSKLDMDSNPTRTHEEEKEEEHEYMHCDEGLSDESLRTALPRFQKLFKNFKTFSHLFVFKDESEPEEMRLEVGYPTDVKHMTHIGLDGYATSFFWNNNNNNNLHSLPLKQFEIAIATGAM
ncbi:CRIB domain-containing protein ric4-like [Orobanche minor]